MSELMLINPRKRKAKRKMTAKQAKYFAPRRKRKAARRAAPARAAAPHRRRRRAAAKSVRVKRIYASPKRRRRSRRSSGGGLSLRSITNPTGIIKQIMPAAIGAAGALVFDIGYAMAPIPATWKAGPLAPLTKIGFIFAAGMLASNVAPKKLVGEAVAGALLVTAFDFIKSTVRTMAPTLPLNEYVSGLGYVSSALQIGYGNNPGMGEYVSEMPVGYNSTPFDMDEVF